VSDTRLVTAVDIAQARVRDMPTGTIEESLRKSAQYLIELRKAKDEIARGEWATEEASPNIGTAA